MIALVFAMMGGAYAANDSGGKATASAKAKKGPRGPKGPKGNTGPVGPQGPAGANGKDGVNGTNGAPGVSVASSVEPQGANCPEGGSKFAVGAAAPTYACNGVTGFTETLPEGKTETGAYARLFTAAGVVATAISFNIPLPTELEPTQVKMVAPPAEELPTPVECEDGVAPVASASHPEADPGFLCVFVSAGSLPAAANNPATGSTGVATSGAELLTTSNSAGTWAVTAPLAP